MLDNPLDEYRDAIWSEYTGTNGKKLITLPGPDDPAAVEALAKWIDTFENVKEISRAILAALNTGGK